MMHSHSAQNCLKRDGIFVLILVVMDDALAQLKKLTSCIME